MAKQSIELDEDTCALCGNQRNITFHHLIPRKCHTNKWFKKNFDKVDMKTRGIYVCRPCHSFIHRQFTEKELGRSYNTLEKLMADEKIRTYVAWARKQR
ncbi:MAG: hypothetical protein AAF902_17755 [Chloroflexota bacterium]